MSLGSLTTAFAPDSTACLDPDSFWMQQQGSGDDLAVQQGAPLMQKPICYPRGYIPVSTSYYSPGVCPSSYTVACSSTMIDQGKEVTAHVCCPDVYWQYSCPPDDATKELEKSPWLTTLGCWSSMSTSGVRTVTRVGVVSNDIVTTTLRAGIVGAHAINVQFRDGDYDGPMQTGTADSSNCSGTPAERGSSDHDRGVSPATVAGISVGSAAGALALAALFWLLLRCLRKRRPPPPSEAPAADGAARQGTFYAPRDGVDASKASHEHAADVPVVAELGEYGNRMSWENTWEHMTISPASAHTQDGRGTPVKRIDSYSPVKKVNSYSAVSAGDGLSL